MSKGKYHGSVLRSEIAEGDFYKVPQERADVDFMSVSLTKQEFAEECDINAIMERYEAQGIVTHVNRANPYYADFTNMPDLREAMDAMREANDAFNSLPANVRREFDNDPQRFVDFAQNPDNLDQMRKWGLASMPETEPTPVSVRVVQEPGSAAPASSGAGDRPVAPGLPTASPSPL